MLTWSKDKVKKEKHFLKVYSYKDSYMLYKKSYLNGNGEKLESPKNSITFNYVDNENLLNFRNTGNIELKSLLGDNNFKTPKPVAVIKWLINRVAKDDSIILDFFAGSGTTGQAVLELNREDRCNRRFILCTNNENNIAYDFMYERLYRIIKGSSFDNKISNFKWLKNNKLFRNSKIRVIFIDDSIKISLDQDVPEKVYDECRLGLKLLDNNYNKKNMNLYYDLSALNPLKNEIDNSKNKNF